MSALRIVHLISSLDAADGGPVTALEGLVLAQKETGTLEPVIVATFRKGDGTGLAERLRERGIEVHLVGPTLDRRWRWHPALARKIRNAVDQGTILHLHGLWEAIHKVGADIGNALNIPVIFRPCGMLDPWSLAQGGWKKRLVLNLYLRAALQRAAALHFTTIGERDLTTPLGLRTNALVVSNGYTPTEMVSGEEWPSVYPQEWKGRKILVFLGRIHPKKNIHLILAAAEKLGSSEPISVAVIGPTEDADYLQELKAQSATMNVPVVYTGALEGVTKRSCLRHAAVLVLPSHQENFGNVLLEALDQGTPVVVSDRVNLHQEITTAGVGTAFSLSGDLDIQAERLATAIAPWLSVDRDDLAYTRQVKVFLGKYHWKAVAETWANHYHSMLKQ